MDSVGKCHTSLYILGRLYTVLIIVIYLNFNKTLNNVLKNDLMIKIKIYGTIKKYVTICTCKLWN